MPKKENEKLVPNLRFKGFTDDWIQEKLSNLYSFSNGINTLKENYGHGRKMISVMDILSKDYLLYENVINYVNVDLSEEENFKVEANDLVFVRSSETKDEVGWTKTYRDTNYSLYSGFVIRGKVYEDVNSFFIENSLNYKQRRQIQALANGSTRYNISQQTLNSIKITLPQLEEQNRISILLEKIDSIITLEQEKLNKLKNLNDQILRMFIYKNWKYSLNYSKSTQQWEKVTLNRILKETNNKTTINNQHEIISSTNDGLYLQSEYFKRQVASKNNIGYKILERNQLVLSPQNLWLGNINFNDKYEIGIVSPSYKTFEINTDFNKYFIGRILSMKEMEQKYMSASEQGASVVRRNLNINEFNQISLFLPDLVTQNFISEFIQNIEDNIHKRSINIQKYSQIKMTLLSEMFV